MKEINLIDIYCTIHPKRKTVTYESTAFKLKSRLDFFLTKSKLATNVTRVETRASVAPDHKAMFLSMTLDDEFKRGPGTWKFNNPLLQDENYLN